MTCRGVIGDASMCSWTVDYDTHILQSLCRCQQTSSCVVMQGKVDRAGVEVRHVTARRRDRCREKSGETRVNRIATAKEPRPDDAQHCASTNYLETDAWTLAKTKPLGGGVNMEQYFRTRASVDDEPDLARNRRANDARLKSRFEHIFAKYGKDFEDVGDEIDLDTGEVVVNNGHLESMRHEVDPGKSVSSQVLQVLGSERAKSKDTIPTVGFVDESSTEDSDYDEGASVAGSSGDSSGDANIDEDDIQQRPKAAARAPDQRFSNTDEARENSQPRLERPDMASRDRNTGANNDEHRIDRTSQPASRGRSPGSEPMDLSFLQNSMQAVLNKPGRGESVDPNVIQALGQSIANQLARFMSNPSKKRKIESSSRPTTNDSRWEYPVLPGDRTARTPSPPPPASSSAALFARSPDDESSIWAAERPRRPKRQRTSLRITEAVDDAVGDDETDNEPQPNDQHAPASSGNRNNETINGKICSHCGDTESRQWRISPAGGYLCNACGTYFFRYGKSRPFDLLGSASKPDFSQTSPGAPQVQRPTIEGSDVFSIPLTSTPGTNGYAANTARRMTGDVRYARLTVEEEDAIIKLRAIDQLDWKSIGKSVSNRAESSVQFHYRKLRKRSDFEDRLRLLAQGTSKSPALSERAYNDTPTPDQSETTPPFVKSASHEISGLQNSPLPPAHVDTIEGPARPKANEGLGSRPRFSTSEKQLLMRLYKGNMEWTQIASCLPGRTVNSIKAMTRRLTLAQRSLASDDAASDESVQPQQRSYTREDDNLMVLMRDQEGMSFAEMIDYFAGRSEADLVLRYEYLKALRPAPPHGQPTSVDVPSLALGGPGPSVPDLRQEAQREPVLSLENGEAHNMTPPPPRPALQHTRINATLAPVASERDFDHGAAPVAHEHNTSAPQTPAFPIPPLSHPPRPLEVGPSAWTATQPASKGPLPFKPARRSLIPLVPRGSHTMTDPFVSRRNSAEDEQTSYTDDAASRNEHRPRRGAKDRARANLKDLYEAFPTADESTSENPSFRNHEGRMASSVAAPQDLPVRDSRGLHAEDGDQASSPAVKARTRTTSTTPEAKRGKPYTKEQSKLIKRLKEQGFSYARIAAQIPDRTPISIQNHYYYTYTSTVPTSKAQSSHKTAKRTPSLPPLLRQALDNSTRRSSTGADVEPLAIYTARKFLREYDGGARADSSPHREDAQDFEDANMQDDGPQTSPEGSVSSDAESDYESGRPNVRSMPQEFDDEMASEMTDLWGVPTSENLYNPSSFPVPPPMKSAGRETDTETPLSGVGSTTLRRKESSPCVYIDNAARSEGSHHECHVSSLDQPAVHDAPAETQAPGVDVAPIEPGDSHDHLHELRASPQHENRPISDEVPSDNDEADISLPVDNNELPDSVPEVEKSQHTEALPQKGTKRKRSPGRSKRVSDFEVADSDSDAVHNSSSQGNADDHDIHEEPATEAPVAPAKRGRGRPRRSVPITATAPEVITISSNPPIKPEAASEGNTSTTQPLKRSEQTQQPTPRSKTSHHSDSALIQRPSTLATPASSGDRNANVLPRSGSGMSKKRFESFSRTAPRESPVTRDPSGGTRRVILATAAKDDDENEDLDELS
jgi:hypothetical protein